MSNSYINNLYNKSIAQNDSERKELFAALTVRFRLFAHQRIRDSMDADEVVQEALVTIASEIDGLEVEKSFASWAYTVLDFRIKAYVKKRAVRGKKEYAGPTDAILCATPDVSVTTELKARLVNCLKAICRRNPRYARALNFHYQGFSTEEVCGRLGISSNNLYAILSRARSLLEYCLKKGDID